MKKVIDINADLGEGTGLDAMIMPYLSSCSIACGGHYGTEETMREAIRLAREHSVKIGAHPSFPDKDNFGRTVLTMTKEELRESVYFQLLQFLAVCETDDVEIHHVKLHGALYNYAAKDAPTSDAVVEAICSLKTRPRLYVQYNSVLHRKAENLLPLEFEAFADRRYTDDGSLAPRSAEGAVITDPDEAWEQLREMVEDEQVTTITGKKIGVNASTFCVHSDTPNAVAILQRIRQRLNESNLIVA